MGDARDDIIATASRAGEELLARGDLAVSASYDPAREALCLTLANGTRVAVPAALIEGLAEADAAARAGVEIAGIGYGLHWPALDLDLSVPGLLAGVCGTQAWMHRQQAARGGAARSAAKSAAARRNGAKGGRPRKPMP